MFKFRKKQRSELEIVLLAQDERLGKLAARERPSSLEDSNLLQADAENGHGDYPDFACSTLISVPTWKQMVADANEIVPEERRLEDILSNEDFEDINRWLAELNESFSSKYRLDKYDVAFAVMSGILAAAVDMFLVGVPQRTHEEGLRGGRLENYVRDKFKEWLP